MLDIPRLKQAQHIRAVSRVLRDYDEA